MDNNMSFIANMSYQRKETLLWIVPVSPITCRSISLGGITDTAMTHGRLSDDP